MYAFQDKESNVSKEAHSAMESGRVLSVSLPRRMAR